MIDLIKKIKEETGVAWVELRISTRERGLSIWTPLWAVSVVYHPLGDELEEVYGSVGGFGDDIKAILREVSREG